MPNRNAALRPLIRTIIGISIGAVTSLVCWYALVLCSTIDDAAHWKGTLGVCGFLLPLFCIAGGVTVTRASESRLNYVVANIGFALLATFLSTGVLMAMCSLPLWMGLALFVPIFFGWAFVVERFVSPTINTYVERLAGPPP